MKILAFEFSSEARSVALVEVPAGGGPSEAVVRGRAGQQAGRGTRAFALVDAALREAGVEREQVDALAVGLGPGSYTGIRVAIAVAQGWQLARAVRVLGLNSVEVLAWQAQRAGIRGPVTFLLDAQRGEFYRAQFELSGSEARPVKLLALVAGDPLSGQEATSLVVEPGLLERFPGARALSPEAGMLGVLAAGREDYVTADQLEPVYLRAVSFVKAPPPRVVPPLK